MKRLALSALLVLLCLHFSWAATKTWAGTEARQLWSDGALWNPVGVPGANDDVTIGGNLLVLAQGSLGTVNSLTMTAPLSLESAELTVTTGIVSGTKLVLDRSKISATQITLSSDFFFTSAGTKKY